MLVFFIVGCGYKPVTHYTKDEIYGLVYLNSEISLQDPQNSIILQDSVTKMIVSNLGLELTDNKTIADTLINVSIGKPRISQIQYDTQSFVKTYRATVTVTLKYQNKDKSKTVSNSGEHDFNVSSASTISENERFNAITQATQKALEDILGKIAVESFKK